MQIFGKDSSPLCISAFYFEIWPLKLLGQCHKGQLGEIISKIPALHVICKSPHIHVSHACIPCNLALSKYAGSVAPPLGSGQKEIIKRPTSFYAVEVGMFILS